MIQAIMKIGKWVGERDGTIGSIEKFVQNPNDKGNIKKVLTITLSKRDDSLIFKDVDMEEFRQKYLLKYLYRRGSSSGADVTPTSKYAGDMKKTFKKKIVRSIQDITKEGKNLGLDSDEQERVQMICDVLSSNEDSITKRLIERSEEIEKAEGAIITLVFLENGKKQYIGDIDLFQKVLSSKAREKYFKQYGKEALGNNQMCSVCLKERAEVYGFVNTYNFYTVDKPGFVTGGFKQQDAWKNYPVCFECAGSLELGKKYLNENLRFNFYGFRYLLIPRFFTDRIMEDSLDVLEDMSDRRATEMIQTGFDQTYINRLTVFNFRVLRNFFPYVSKARSYDKQFLELVGKIFSLKPVDYHLIIKAIVTKLRSRFVNDEYTKIDCLAGYLLLNYLAGLGILSKGGERMEVKPIEDLKESFGSEDTSVSDKIELFFDAHEGFFDNAEKKASFLVGILIQKLMNIQWQEKNATPFRAKLYGLRLTEPLLKKISYEAQDKLEQYKQNYYRELENVIAQYMVVGGSGWSLTNDEISFYFTMGMNLADLFKSKKEGDNNDRPEE